MIKITLLISKYTKNNISLSDKVFSLPKSILLMYFYIIYMYKNVNAVALYNPIKTVVDFDEVWYNDKIEKFS